MKKIFNREFTQGHLFHNYGPQLMNPIRPNHIGVEIGTVVKVSRDKIGIRLSRALHQGDGIRILQDGRDIGFKVNFLYKNGLLVNHADAQDIVELDKTEEISKGSKVLKTSDTQQLPGIAGKAMKASCVSLKFMVNLRCRLASRRFWKSWIWREEPSV